MSLAPHKFLGATLGHVMPNTDFAGMSQIGIPHLNHGPCNYWYLSLVVKLAMFLFWYEHAAVVWVSSCRL